MAFVVPTRCTYQEDAPDGAGPAVGEDMLVLSYWVYAAAGCYEQWFPVMDDAIGLISRMNSNPNSQIFVLK
jgi:hypothetical protein